MRGLKFNIKCVFCRHKKVCHEELGEVQRLRGIIEELKLENEEYERQIQIIQHERILLQNEVADLKRKKFVNTFEPVFYDTPSKNEVLSMLNYYTKQAGCKNCIGKNHCGCADEEYCDEILYSMLERHFRQMCTTEIKQKLNEMYGYVDTDSVNTQNMTHVSEPNKDWKQNIATRFERVE